MVFGVGTGYIFDDGASIGPLLQLRQDPDAFWPLVFDGFSGPLGRPIALFTFALEQRFFAATPDFSQTIAIGIHSVNSVLIFAVLLLVFASYEKRERYYWAVIGAVLWACAPQKVSTVLYIVQRMTMLGTLLTLLALWAYLKGRHEDGYGKAGLFFAISLIAVLLAPFAKENGVLAVPVIASAELFLFARDRSSLYSRRLYILAATILTLGILAFFALGIYEWGHSTESYSRRNFGYWDRVLAAPTILMDYVRQFYLPDIRRMGLLHDDWPILGSGLSMLSSIIASFGLIAMIVTIALGVKHKRLSLAGFGASVFLIGHSIESSFLPLELYFEHRNYLPSFGLVLIAAELYRVIRFRFQSKFPRLLKTVSAAYLLIVFVSVGMLASWWRTSGLLMQHHFTGHPNSSRAHAEVAFAQARVGDVNAAFESLERAVHLSLEQPAARSMGVADQALLQNALVCISGGDGFVLPSPANLALEENGVRTVVFRVYSTLFKDEACVDAPWRKLSNWFLNMSLYYNENGLPWGVPTLIDLALFEQTRGNALGTFSYAAMILEQQPEQATALLLLAKASQFLGDEKTLADALSRLQDLNRKGLLDRLDQHVLADFIRPTQ